MFSWGNPSRGDDALGPACHERLSAMSLSQVELLTDFQLQIEHCLDLQQRRLVIFVDASINVPAPFSLAPVKPCHDHSYTSHAMSPQALLQVCEQVIDGELPECWLMQIRGYEFALGTGLTPPASANLDKAIEELVEHIRNYIP